MKASRNLDELLFICLISDFHLIHVTKDCLAEWSKAPASGAGPAMGEGSNPSAVSSFCHFFIFLNLKSKRLINSHQ